MPAAGGRCFRREIVIFRFVRDGLVVYFQKKGKKEGGGSVPASGGAVACRSERGKRRSTVCSCGGLFGRYGMDGRFSVCFRRVETAVSLSGKGKTVCLSVCLSVVRTVVVGSIGCGERGGGTRWWFLPAGILADIPRRCGLSGDCFFMDERKRAHSVVSCRLVMRKGGGECIDLVSRRNPIAVGAGRRKRSVSVVYDVWPIPAPCFHAGGRASREAFPGSYFRSGPDVGPSVVSVHAGAGGGMGGPGNLWERHWTVRPWACSASRCSCFLRVGAVVAAFCGRFGAGRSFGAGRDRAAPKSLPFFDISSSVAVSSGGQSEVCRKKYVDFFAKDWLKWKKCLPLFL